MADVELLAALKPGRFPEAAPVVAADDVLFAVAIGLAAGLLIALCVAAWRRGGSSARDDALDRIARAEGAAPGERLAAAAAALRDYARRAGAADVATAHGEAFRAGLDRLFGTDFFGAGAGRLLADGLYAPADGAAVEAAVRGAADLIRRRRR